MKRAIIGMMGGAVIGLYWRLENPIASVLALIFGLGCYAYANWSRGFEKGIDHTLTEMAKAMTTTERKRVTDRMQRNVARRRA